MSDPRGSLDTLEVELKAVEPLYGPILRPGAVVARHVIEALAGRGGFGHVYRARADGGQPVAIKVLRAELADWPNILRRFALEADAVARVRHPGIAELLEVGQLTDGRPYLVMAWAEGPTLEARLAEVGRMAPGEIVTVLEPLCDALGAVHAAGVIHRDLKLSNVILSARGPVLLDFGIVKLLDQEGSGLTTTGVRIGTPSCMAPEQILGGAIGPAVDVYALGVLVFQLLTGRLPFVARGLEAVQRMHLQALPPRPSEVAGVPALFDDLVLRCLDKVPARRPPAPAAVAAALREALSRPGTRPRIEGGTVAGVALHLVAPPGDARARCEAAGLLVQPLDDGALLAFHAGVASMSAALELALQLVEGSPATCIQVSAGTLVLLVVAGQPQLAGGDLLELDAWVIAPPRPGVLATAAAVAALDGLERSFHLEPQGGGRALVRRRPTTSSPR